MFRIGYMSDLHLEFEQNGPDRPSRAWFAFQKKRKILIRNGHPNEGPLLDQLGDIDLMILAGDISIANGVKKGLSAIDYAEKIALYLGVPVILIAGNHDFYLGDINKTLAALEQEGNKRRSIHFLEQDVFLFSQDDKRLYVLGTTLWTDFDLFGDAKKAMILANESLNDFRQIRDEDFLFTPEASRERHFIARNWLKETSRFIQKDDPEATILIVTHHAPCFASVPEDRRNNALSAAYASRMEKEIAEMRPAAWIHGHLHGVRRHSIADVPVICAARGYIGHESEAVDFLPQTLILGHPPLTG